MLLVKTYVAPSSVHGLGLFAAEIINSGELIWNHDFFFDKVFDKLDEDHLSKYPLMKEFFNHFCWRHPVSKLLHCSLDNERFCNHSRTPNTSQFDKVYEMHAARDIEQGEEITCDYRTFDLDSIENPEDYI